MNKEINIVPCEINVIPFGFLIASMKEGDRAVCVDDGSYQAVCCIDNEVFVWEDSGKTIQLNGAFLRMNWQLQKGKSRL